MHIYIYMYIHHKMIWYVYITYITIYKIIRVYNHMYTYTICIIYTVLILSIIICNYILIIYVYTSLTYIVVISYYAVPIRPSYSSSSIPFRAWWGDLARSPFCWRLSESTPGLRCKLPSHLHDILVEDSEDARLYVFQLPNQTLLRPVRSKSQLSRGCLAKAKDVHSPGGCCNVLCPQPFVGQTF